MMIKQFSRHRVLTFCVLLLLCAVFCTGCGTHHASDTRLVLGTVVTVQLYGRMSQEDADAAVDAAFAKAQELEQVFSAALPDSELSRINADAARAPVPVSEDMYTVLEKSLSFAKQSDGAFDPTLGRLIRLWNIDQTALITSEKTAASEAQPADPESEVLPEIPSGTDLLPLAGCRHYNDVLLDPENRTVFFDSDDFELHLGAIAKGYAADQIRLLLKADPRIRGALVNLGGNVIAIGKNADGNAWRIGIANPFAPEDTSALAAALAIGDETVVTSGDYQRYIEGPDGKIYHHILDPATGYPAEAGLHSVTVIGDCSADCDALSTALFILGEDRGKALLASFPGLEAVFIRTDGTLSVTDGLRNRLIPGVLPVSD